MDYLKSNWKDITSWVIGVILLVGFIDYATGYKQTVEDGVVVSPGWWPVLLDIGSAMIQGSVRFVFVLFLGWTGLKITLPEGASFIFGEEFDAWWREAPTQIRAIVSLSAAAVITVVAAVCFISAVG